MYLKIFNHISKYFSSNYRRIIQAFFTISLILFLLSVMQVLIGNIGGFQPLEFGFGFLLYGAFNWADVMVFSFLWIIITVILLHLRRKEFFWIAYFSYWFVRSSGEVIYSFLQQFHPEVKPWLVNVPKEILRNKFLGPFIMDQFWILEQIFFQSIAVLSIIGLIYTLVKLFESSKK